MDGVATKPVAGASDMAKFLRVVKEADLNQLEAVGDFAADPKSQAKMFLQYHTGMFDPATLPKVMAITPNLQLAVQPPPGSSGSHEETLAYLSAANKKLPPELQVGWDELKQIGGVSDTIELTGEPHPDKYNPATDPTDSNPVATPFKVQENDLSKFLSIVDKNNVSVLMEGSPHKVSLPVQMAMQHYQTEDECVEPQSARVGRESIVRKYFDQAEQAVQEQQVKKQNFYKQYAQTIAERVLMKESAGQQAAIAIAKKKSGKYNKDGKRVKENEIPGHSMGFKPGAGPGMQPIEELSTELLGRYKKASYADAKKADSEGDYARGDKRFKGINKATVKQFDNDLKKHEQNPIKEANAKKRTLKNSNPCWDGYKPVGTKKKGGRTVPNCVPKE
jgi:hypothetical protein